MSACLNCISLFTKRNWTMVFDYHSSNLVFCMNLHPLKNMKALAIVFAVSMTPCCLDSFKPQALGQQNRPSTSCSHFFSLQVTSVDVGKISWHIFLAHRLVFLEPRQNALLTHKFGIHVTTYLFCFLVSKDSYAPSCENGTLPRQLYMGRSIDVRT